VGAGLNRLSFAARRLLLGLGLLPLAGFGQRTAAAVLGDPDASDALHELAAFPVRGRRSRRPQCRRDGFRWSPTVDA